MANKVKVITFEERKAIKNLINKGYKLSEISRDIGRGKNTIIAEVRRNGGPLLYDPVKAEERYQILRKAKIERCREMNRNPRNNPYKALQTRIQNLEMQVEILVEAIKELRHED